MKREETYCDVCGTKMSYVNSDGETSTQGIFILKDIWINVNIKTTSGESTTRIELGDIDCCSAQCAGKELCSLVDRMYTAAENMPPL